MGVNRLIDSHVHLMRGDPQPLVERLKAFGARRLNALGVPVLWGADNNFLCLRMKRLLPGGAWAFGGLIWQGRHCPEPARQLELMLAAGFDGLKLIETKPNLQKQTGFLPDDAHFEPLFALAEARAVPVVWHVGDPAPFWHRDQAPDFALANGWTYEGPGFLSLGELYERTERVLGRHPALRAVLAHFYFCSDDRGHLERLLETSPNAHVDVTPGSEMYRAFAQDRPGWEAFFKRYAGRVLLGSDMTNAVPDSAWRELSALTRGILRPDPFRVWDIGMTGFDLSEGERALVTGGNFARLAGETPRDVDPGGLRALLAFYREHLDRDEYAACLAACEEMM